METLLAQRSILKPVRATRLQWLRALPRSLRSSPQAGASNSTLRDHHGMKSANQRKERQQPPRHSDRRRPIVQAWPLSSHQNWMGSTRLQQRTYRAEASDPALLNKLDSKFNGFAPGSSAPLSDDHKLDRSEERRVGKGAR